MYLSFLDDIWIIVMNNLKTSWWNRWTYTLQYTLPRDHKGTRNDSWNPLKAKFLYHFKTGNALTPLSNTTPNPMAHEHSLTLSPLFHLQMCKCVERISKSFATQQSNQMNCYSLNLIHTIKYASCGMHHVVQKKRSFRKWFSNHIYDINNECAMSKITVMHQYSNVHNLHQTN